MKLLCNNENVKGNGFKNVSSRAIISRIRSTISRCLLYSLQAQCVHALVS